MNQSWSIIIIAFNEEETISQVVAQTLKFFAGNNIEEKEILIVDDGSTDNSGEIISDICNKNKIIKYIRHKTNLGIGQALLSGYKNAVKENVVMIPADGQFDIDELKEHINFSSGNFLSFYREEKKDYSLFRKSITGLNKLYNKHFLNLEIKDVNWVKAFKTGELKKLDLQLESSLVGSEICAKLNFKGIKAIEIPSVYHIRKAGVAKGASFSNLIKAFKELTKLTFVTRKYKAG